ncbi:uncharacterized protein LOC143287184 [Babylonia areolata]|uniref:uncharacterized protein LOC143287184 n=1 Tax=Babylonia areolata TaxID=304850 RepID=UPI003FD0DFDE
MVPVWAAAEAGRQKRTYPSRCYPGTTCWPSNEDIAHLDKVTAGSVLQPSSQNYRDNILYANERMTKHPGLVLLALSVDDVQKGVLFARKFHLLLSVRAANALKYDYFGRLSNDGGFVIDVSGLKAVTASTVTTSNDPGSVNVQSGATWQEVYAAVEGSGRVVVGTNPSDSVLDTTVYPGISPMSRALGLVSDNLLSARVVLADGRLATVSAGGVTVDSDDAEGPYVTNDPELFYALRGGGYNFAVPVSFTFRLYFPPFQVAYVDGLYKLYVNGQFLGRDALKFVLREVQDLPTEWGGYVMVDGSPSTVDPADRGTVAVNLFHYGPWSGTGVSSITNLLNYSPSFVKDRFDVNVVDNFQQYRGAAGEKDVFDSWPNAYLANTLIGRDVFNNNTRLDEFVDFLLDVVNAPAVDSNLRCIARLLGGQIATKASMTDAVSPEFRDAVMSVTCGVTWRDSLLKESEYISLAMRGAAALRSFGKGVDPRFAQEDLEDWKSAVFSSKYSDLLETKSRWDIDNFLWNYNHIASDFRLNCRRGKCH